MPNSEKSVEVLFAPAGWKPLDDLVGPAMIIAATTDSFNDFGRMFRTLAHLIADDGSVQTVPHRLMFEGEDTTRSVLDALGNDGPVRADHLAKTFCSVFGDADDYDRLVELFGFDRTFSALRLLKDVNVLGEADEDREALNLTRTADFALGMIREPDTYNAYRRGGRRLVVVKQTDVRDAAATFGGEFRVGNSWRTIAVEFDFEPDDFLRDRMAVLVGPNGTGKSAVLAGILQAIRSGRTAPSSDDEDWCDYLSPPPRFRKVIVVDSSDGTRYPRKLDPSEVHDYTYVTQSGAGEVHATTSLALVDILRDPAPLFLGPNDPRLATRKQVLQTVLQRLGLWEGAHLALIDNAPSITGASRIGGIYAVPIKALTAEQQSLLAYQHTDHQRGVIHVRHGQVVELSSGELMFFRLAVLIISAVEQASIFLIDEPENHLHPHYVAELMGLLDRVLKPTRSCAIIATHSPFVVREVPRRRVNVLHRDGRALLAGPPRLQTFGASVEAIAHAVFTDGEDSRLHEELLDAWILDNGFKAKDLPTLVETYGDDLNPETLSYIAMRLRQAE